MAPGKEFCGKPNPGNTWDWDGRNFPELVESPRGYFPGPLSLPQVNFHGIILIPKPNFHLI